MIKKGVFSFLALIVMLLLLPGTSHALTDEQKVLVGLKGVHVLVEEMNPKAERLGLNKPKIKTDVELRLRKAGIRVLTEKEQFEMPGGPALYVNINSYFPPNIAIVAFSIDIELMEWVTLASGFKALGAIWRTRPVGIGRKDEMKEIRGFIGDAVDRFINDYLAANPK
jgi:hypothetical protein